MCSTRVLYSFDSGGSLLSTLLGRGDLSQLIAAVNDAKAYVTTNQMAHTVAHVFINEYVVNYG